MNVAIVKLSSIGDVIHALPVAVPLVDHGPLVVAQVADRRDAGRELAAQAFRDHRVELLGGVTGQAVQRAVLAVRAQVDVGVDESG